MDPVKRRKVVLGLVEDNGQFIVIQRKHPHLHITWAFPGGIVHENESDIEAVEREIREEVKVDINIQEKIAEWQHPNTQVWITYYYCTLKPDSPHQPQVGEADEITSTRWASVEDIFTLFDPKAEIHPAVREFLTRRLTFSSSIRKATSPKSTILKRLPAGKRLEQPPSSFPKQVQ